MNQEREQQINALFEQLVALTDAQRLARLGAIGSADPALRQAVERRLRADAEAGSFLEEPLSWPSAVSKRGIEEIRAATAPPDRIGPYRILCEIGRGGMGTVYAAERDDGTFDRRVAIKVINSRSSNPEVARRLRAERRILALLEHPNIARIYDGGSTDDGAPYLVMEHVEGTPIDHYCTENALSSDQRVVLMGKVCQAVDYAHRNLVVHRDLKPSNILVRKDGEPMLLDFGIAKLLEPHAPEDHPAETTAPWRRLLTVNYASPEEIRGESISTASDVYSLGVLLFLLLTGSLPRSFAGLSPLQVEQRLRDTEPPRPSLAARAYDEGETGEGEVPASDSPARSARRLRKDLDPIVLKALRTDPEARYHSAQQLAEDLDRYRHGFPVSARQGTLRYRAGKLLRRHRLAAAASAVALFLGVALLVALAIATSTLAKSQGRLQTERNKLEATLSFFLDMFEDAGPYVTEGIEITLRQAVERHAQRLDHRLTDQPAIRAEILSTLGWVYLDLGDVEQSLTHHQQALALRQAHFGEHGVEVAESLDGVAAALRDAFRLDEAAETGADALSRYRTFYHRNPATGPGHLLRSLNNRVKLFCLTEDWHAADPLSEEALELVRSDPAIGAVPATAAIIQRALVLDQLDKPDPARALYHEALDRYERQYGSAHALLAPLYNNLAQIEKKAGNLEQAATLFRQADHQYESAFGDDFYERIIPLNSLGKLLHRLGDHPGAEDALRTALDVATRAPGLGPEHERTFFGRPAIALGTLLAENARCDEVVELLSDRVTRWAGQNDGPPVPQGRALLEQCAPPSPQPAHSRAQ